MKKLLNLPSVLRVCFGVAQLFVLIGGVSSASLFLASLAPRTGPVFTLPFTHAILRTPPALLGIKSPTSSAEDIRLTRLTGYIVLNPNSTDRRLAAAIRETLLPHFIFQLVLAYLILGLLRNLCARAEQGEVFSEANLRSIRNLGVILISGSLTGGALQIWSTHRLGGYLAEHAIITGINATLSEEAAPMIELPFDTLITGLLVLLLAEAFRQGLALKKENDLTV